MVPDRWLVLTVRVRPPGSESRVAHALLELGARGVEERDGACVTYLPPPDDPESLVARARARLRRLEELREVDLSWSWQPHQDWAETWKRGLAPRRVTERLVVTPSWCEPETRSGDRVVRVDPGVAFGTAEHATTRGCLRLLDPVVRGGERILDVGAGSGILSIAAALLGAAEVVALEADPHACETARENLRRNEVADRVRVEEVRIDGAALADRGPADGIVANLRTGILVELLPGAARALRPDGWLVAAGIREEDRDRILEEGRSSGFALGDEDEEDGWWSGRLRRRSGRGAPGRSDPAAGGASSG